MQDPETLKKQALFFQGKDHWLLNTGDSHKEVRTADGPNGLRIEDADTLGFSHSRKANAYPTASCIACSFDEELLEEYGKMLGEECAQAGVDVLLGPGVNTKRSPLCGRNFEYYSEDPYLSGKLASAYIRGLQSKGISACLKHFAGNEREYRRLTSDSIIDERALHELYLKQFEIAVREGHPHAMMLAYNRLNGVYCAENKELMDLARSWGFDGVFFSDWGGVSSPEKSLEAGLNIEMPGGSIGADEALLEGVKAGTVKAETIQKNAERVKAFIETCGHYEKKPFDQKAHEAFLQKAAAQSAVLLKNDNGVLPLHKEEKIAWIGALLEEPRMQGGGSSRVNTSQVPKLSEVLKEKGYPENYAPGYDLERDKINEEKIAEAKILARHANKVVLVMGNLEKEECEGYDRTSLDLPYSQLRLLEEIASVNPNVIVVLETGAPVNVSWRRRVKGILCMYLAGQQVTSAMVSLLYGECEPCGHLAESWPERLTDTPADAFWDLSPVMQEYRESIFTGYRYYTGFGIHPAWPFGYGLSYGHEGINALNVTKGKKSLRVQVTLTSHHTSSYPALIQIYASKPDSRIAGARRILVGFEKVVLKTGETKDVTLKIPYENLAYWDTKYHAWSLEEGNYQIQVCADSETVLMEESVHLKGNAHPFTRLKESMFRVDGDGLHVSLPAFAGMLGRAVPLEPAKKPFSQDSTIADLKACGLGRAVNSVIGLVLHLKHFDVNDPSSLVDEPMRQLLWLKGGVTWKTVRLAVDYMNHHRWKTLHALIQSMK
jgi:beta-glucosidase